MAAIFTSSLPIIIRQYSNIGCHKKSGEQFSAFLRKKNHYLNCASKGISLFNISFLLAISHPV